jgi:putative ABC transport system substrate-binding protein
MRRREFMAGLGSAAAWPVVARAQEGGRVRRIGVFLPDAASDPESMSRIAALLQGLQELGWTDGRNVRIDFRWGAGEADQYRKVAAELIALAPDIVVARGTLSVAALQRTSRTVPIVFVQVADPVGGGIVESLARPGGNTTGFASPEYEISGTAQSDYPLAHPRCGHARSWQHRRNRSIRGDPVGGFIAQSGIAAL